MNTPNPLMPQGSLQQPQARAKSNVRVAVFAIIAVHAVFFGGLLMQGGCKPGEKKAGAGSATDQQAANTFTNELPKLDNSLAAPTQDLPLSTNAGAASFSDISTGAVHNLAPIASAPSTSTSTLPPAPTGEGKDYVIAKGDTMAKVASAHGVSLSALTKANPGVDSRKLKVGQKIQIPASSGTAAGSTGSGSGSGTGAGTGTGAGVEPTKADAAGTTTYVVKTGDTLTKIAKDHGVTIKAVRAANGLKSDRVHVGQKIKLPAPTAAASARAAAPSGTTTR